MERAKIDASTRIKRRQLVKLRNHQDLWSGIMFAVLGILFIALSRQYQLGTAAKMGPGYFPTVLGGILTVLGVMIVASAFSKSNPEAKLAPVGWRELFLLLLGVRELAGQGAPRPPEARRRVAGRAAAAAGRGTTRRRTSRRWCRRG